jgi:hypothetical protein
MRYAAIAWIGGTAGLVGYLMVRYAMLQSQLARARKLLIEHDHTEALVENAFHNEARRLDQGLDRLYRDAGLLPPEDRQVRRRVTVCEIAPHGIIEAGVCVRAHCVEEAAEIIAQAPQFYPRSAA